jgi:iron complex transport system permease protein
MALNFDFSSAVFLLLSYVNQQMGGGSLRWIFGQVPWLSLREVAWFATGIIPLLVVELIYARHLDAIAMGDAVARTLGFSPKTVRPILLIVSSIHISLIVSISGAIGFVGLIVPHAVRLFFHPSSTRTLQLLSFVLGAVFLILSDTLSRKLLPPFEFPIGIITTLFGGPLFLLLLWRRKN